MNTSPHPSSPMPLRVFIVDDEAPSRQRMKNLLSDIQNQIPNVVVGEAVNGVEALEMILRQPVDVVLADIRMPHMDGLELAVHLTALERSPAVIFVTAYDQHAVKAFELEALDFLVKPVRADRLSASLRRAKPGNITTQHLRTLCPSGRTHLRCLEHKRILLVPVNTILYLKAEDKYVSARTWERSYLLNESLSKLEEEYPEIFIRLRRNCLAARNAISGFERQNDLDLQHGHWIARFQGISDEILVGRRMWPNVREAMKHKFGSELV